MRRWLSLLLFLFAVSTTHAQLRVSLEGDRTTFLQYAPVSIRIVINNNTDQDILLQNSGDNPWLSFVVARADGFPVRADQKFSPAPIAVKAGETKQVTVNITPYYAFRDAGNYKVQASVDVPGGQPIASGNLMFNVVKGQVVWQKARPVDASERTYTLLRFSPNNQSTELYLRVDDLKENLVYSVQNLGPIIAMVTPKAGFDKEGKLHVLHTSAQGNYCYSRLDANGALENQAHYEAEPEAPPSLVQTAEGTVIVLGGHVDDKTTQREKLSEATFGLPDAPAAVRIDPSAKAAAKAN
jgi:hypothetical protein